MKDRDIDPYWRPAFEVFSGGVWIFCALTTGLFGYYGDFGLRFLLLASIPMGLMGLLRLYQGNKIMAFKANLFSKRDLNLNLADIIKISKDNPGEVYYGHGFKWEQDSTQRATDYTNRTESLIQPNKAYMKIRAILGYSSKGPKTRSMYLHGMGGKEVEIFNPVVERTTHRSIGGSTGTGKGRVLAIDIIQSIVRGEAGLMIDPKEDGLCVDTAYATMKFMNKEELFFFFNPSTPLSSVRINPLANYSQVSHLTDRIISLMPESSDEQFKNFAWKAVQITFSVLIMMNGQPTLVGLKRAIEAETHELLFELGIYYLNQFKKTQKESEALAHEEDRKKGAVKFVLLYEKLLKPDHPNDVVESMISVCAKNQEHYKKLIENLGPLLEMLTQGSLKELLSPVEGDNDPRPIVNLKKISDVHGFLYANLSSLLDQTVGSYIGALLVADAVNVAGVRHGNPLDSQVDFSIWIDEAAEVVNKKAIMVANKTRSAEVALTLAFQTIPDLEERLASKAAAEMLMGNMVTKSQLRAGEPTTADYMAQTFGTTKIKNIGHAHTTQTTAMREDLDYNTGYNKTITEEEVYKVSADSLRSLSDLHYFNSFKGNVVYKLRVPYIPIPEHLRYPREKFSNDPHGRRDTIDVMAKNPVSSISFEPNPI